MRPHIQAKSGIPGGINFFTAYQGFSEMGLECVMFNDVEELDTGLRSDVVVGGLGVVQHALARFGVTPPHIDYPEELSCYLGRHIWTSTLDEIVSQPEVWPVFVKPIDEKRFTGVVV
ncbi:MAG: ATP-grasp domain-containing protein, partial [Atopobiaceae bacterium]|nr:ATP-grasp domain-containing protein [Atopobiaceae bacterium]